MYAAPPCRKMKVYASIPSRFYMSGKRSNGIDVQLHGAGAPEAGAATLAQRGASAAAVQ